MYASAPRVRVLQSTSAAGRRVRLAQRRLIRLMEAAVEHAGLATDEQRQPRAYQVQAYLRTLVTG